MDLDVNGVPIKGKFRCLAQAVNRLVDQVGSFASEAARGGQAEVRGVAGTWKDLTDSVNFMAGSLTGQVRNISAPPRRRGPVWDVHLQGERHEPCAANRCGRR